MRLTYFIYLFLCFSICFSYAQNKAETEIRDLEFAFKDALEKVNSAAVFKLVHLNYVVNNPTGKISTKPEISELFRTGKVNFSKFDQEIKRIFFTKNIAVVMGNEKYISVIIMEKWFIDDIPILG